MLPEFGLINMNGRAYDPVLGRMLQVDNYVQNPFSSQSYNRYSYVLNNPLKYVDPSGELVSLITAWLQGFVHGVFSSGSNRLDNGLTSGDLFTKNNHKIRQGLTQTNKKNTSILFALDVINNNWTERSADQHAANYFEQEYGVDPEIFN